MKSRFFSITFYAKKTKILKNGNIPIYARITYNSQRAEFATRLTVKVEQWDSHKNLVKGFTVEAKKINDEIHKIRAKLISSFEELTKENYLLSATKIKQYYAGEEPSKRMTILTLFQEHNENIELLVGKDFTLETFKKYVRLRRQLFEFITFKYNVKDIPLQDINPQFISDFTTFLRTKLDCDNNTTVHKLKCFKKIIRIAMANGYINSDPFKNSRFRYEEVEVDFLTEDELKAITNKKFSIERLQQVKDIYVFCCYTGLAYIDIKELKQQNIKLHHTGKSFIEKRRHKTNVLSTIPLFKPAIDIIEKYKNHPSVIKDKLVLPVLSNQKMNAYLKEIADLCGIEKRLTTHTARHTFATTVALPNGLSLDITAKIIGHSTTKITTRYARITSDLILNSTNHIFEKFD